MAFSTNLFISSKFVGLLFRQGFWKSAKPLKFKWNANTKGSHAVVPTGNANQIQAIPCEQLLSLFRLQVRSCKITIIENAAKLQNQLSQRSFNRRTSFFGKDFLWKKARYSYLMSFAGWFMFHEEEKKLNAKLDLHCHAYNGVCDAVKDIAYSHHKQQVDVIEDAIHVDESKGLVCNLYASGEDAVTQCDSSSTFLPESDECDDYYKNVFNDVYNEKFSCTSSEDSKSIEILMDSAKTSIISDSLDIDSGSHLVMQVISSTCGDCMALPISNNNNFILCEGRFGRDVLNHTLQGVKKISYHPNLVMVEQAFIEKYPKCDQLHTAAHELSAEKLIHEMFAYDQPKVVVVTKSYDCTLKELMRESRLDSNSVILLILQLLEAVYHLETNHVVHRSISPDSVYIKLANGGHMRALLGDFSLAFGMNNDADLLVPFEHLSLDTRPTACLILAPPEVVMVKPGKGVRIDYRKFDVWSVGLLAKQILTAHFHTDLVDDGDVACGNVCRVSNVRADILSMLLIQDSQQRPSAREVADILHLEMFALPPCLSSPFQYQRHMMFAELRDWLLTHCAEWLLRRGESMVLLDLCSKFFARVEPTLLATAYSTWIIFHEFNQVLEGG